MFDRKKFDRDFERTKKAIWFVWWLTIAIILAVLGGGAFVVYKVLVFFGIL